MNRHSQIADAVVTAINAASLGDFTAVRKLLPGVKREDLSTIQVQVIPSTFAEEQADRARKRCNYGVDVGVQQEVDPDDSAAFDVLQDLLMVSIRGLLNQPRLSTLTVATWLRTETVGGAEAGFAPEHLESQRIYTGVLRFTFQVIE
jgi:hypothetical protein